MKKNILPLVLALAVFSSSVPVFASDITVNVNSQKVVLRTNSRVIKDNRTLIPLRGVMEKNGCLSLLYRLNTDSKHTKRHNKT